MTQNETQSARMTHWKLTLSYHGAHFHGWQIQPRLITVQGTLAEALRQITGAAVLPQGAGRTDAGVHALAQVASFSLPIPIPAANLQRALNRVLPASLRVTQAEIVPASFHARHSARRKVYEYRIFERPPKRTLDPASPDGVCSPFLAPFVWDCRWPLDFSQLGAAAALLLGTHDFSAMGAAQREPRSAPLQSRSSSTPNPVKTIHSSAWTRKDGLLVYRVCGSGFLHHMVRNLVGTMVDIGRGSRTPADLSAILASRNRAQAGPTAPASGLFLVEVQYAPLTPDAPSTAPSSVATEVCA